MSRVTLLLAALLAVLATCAGATLLGATSYSPRAAVAALTATDTELAADDRLATDHAILVELRLPRVVGMFLVGALLAAAGALMQSLLGTPLADPYVLGAAGGAAVGAIGVLLAGGGLLVSTGVGAFAGAVGATFLTLAVARLLGGALVHLVLAGLCVSAVLGAALGLMLLASSSAQRGGGSALAWLLGGIVPLGWRGSALALAVLAVVLLWALAWGPRLDAYGLDREVARTLGISPGVLVAGTVAIAALATAAAVSRAGLIGFVGALVPLAVRPLAGAATRRLLPAAALLGGGFLVAVDTLARTVVPGLEVPAGIVAAVIGAPLVLLALRGSNAERGRA